MSTYLFLSEKEKNTGLTAVMQVLESFHKTETFRNKETI